MNNNELINNNSMYLSKYVLMIDTNFIINPHFPKFYSVMKPLLKSKKTKLLIPSIVISELQKLSSKDENRKVILSSLKLIREMQSDDLCEFAFSNDDPSSHADAVFLTEVIRAKCEWRSRPIAVLTFDNALSADIILHINKLKSTYGQNALVLRMNSDGILYPFDINIYLKKCADKGTHS